MVRLKIKVGETSFEKREMKNDYIIRTTLITKDFFVF